MSQAAPTPTERALGAFCAHAQPRRAGRPGGPLEGLTFAVKDVFALAGHRACFGNPTWLATHAPASSTARVVETLLDAGATLVGVTLTDELAFSLTGENSHYGTPLNPVAPERVPGGSSSGSAGAVAGGACDFALGTDTGGSVRVPASHCGLWGFRPTHGVVSLEGVLPFAPRFDTVGWFARDAETLARVGASLLLLLLPEGAPPSSSATPPASGRPGRAARTAPEGASEGAPERAPGPATWRPRRVVLPPDALALVDGDARAAIEEGLQQLARALGDGGEGDGDRDRGAGGAGEADEPLGEGEAVGPLTSWLGTYGTLQNAEMARLHADWIAQARPLFGPLIGPRVARALAGVADDEGERAAEAHLLAVRARVRALLADGETVVVLPSACGVAPRRGRSVAEIDAETGRSLILSSVASLGGVPQLTLPLCRVDGLPLGLSLLGGAGHDRALLALGRRLAQAIPSLGAAAGRQPRADPRSVTPTAGAIPRT